MSLGLSECEILNDLKKLMNNERIQPEPEFKCFSRYLANLSKEEFLKDEETLHLINSHGLQLRSDVKYWFDKREENSSDELKLQVPVIDPKNFIFKDINDVVQKLQELPSEWTVVQITKEFLIQDSLRKAKNEAVPGIHITRFACGELAKRVHPYSVSINQKDDCQGNIFEELRTLVKTRREYYNLGRTCRTLQEAYNNTNAELMSFVKELQLYILRQWVCLFRGRLEDTDLESETLALVKKLIVSFCEKEKMEVMPDDKLLDIVYQVTLSAHFMKNKDIFTVLRSVLYNADEDVINAGELMLLVENIKLLNLSRNCALKRANFGPVILILDNEFEMVPWEMITPLRGQPACRISSLHLLYALYKYHQPYIKNGYRIVEIDSAYCLINPSKDLETCEKQMKEFLKKRMPWAEVEVGKAPDSKDIISKMEDISAYLYCGHGSGTQYLKAGDLKKAFVKGLVLLFGCSSNIPRNCGGKTPHQNNTYTYITNGCPCTIGCIQDVGSTDADAACEEMLTCFMPGFKTEGSETVVLEPKEPNVLKALVAGKGVCVKFWSKSVFVARGIPCKTVIGDVSKITNIKAS